MSSNASSGKTRSPLLYKINDKPPGPLSVILGFQNIIAAFGGIVAPPLVIGGAIGLDVATIALLVSATIFVAGLVTMIQSKGVGIIGSKTPCMMGTDFTFVGPSIAVGSTMGLAGIFGATILGSFVEIVLSRFIKPLMKFFPPVVTGTVVTLIGLTLVPVSIDWAAGGFGSPDYGSLLNISIAMGVMFIILMLNRYAKGLVSSASVLIGMGIGYIVCIPLGMVDFTPVKDAAWIGLPGIPLILEHGIKFSFAGFITFAAAYLVTTIESVGCLIAVSDACEEEIGHEQLSSGILADGTGSFLAGLLGTTPNTTFSQNVGLIPITKIGSRHVVTVAGILLMLLGIFPKLGALIAVMPNPVLGGAGIVMFGMVAASGMKTLSRVDMNNRNLLIVAVAVGLGLGVTCRPDFLAYLPEGLKMIFSSGISTGTIAALLLNMILLEEK